MIGSRWEVFMFRIALLLAVMMAASAAIAQADHAADRAAIQAVLDTHGTAWTRGDAEAAVSTLTDDADWVSGSGITLEGKPAIEAMHKQVLAGPAKGSRHSHPGTPKIRFVTNNVAIVDGDSMMAMRDDTGKELPATYSRYTAVFVKKPDSKWYVTAFRSLPQIKVER
jgi:uncharacterized protein (TIGR02246 family)